MTFLFTDIVGSTRRWERDAAAMRAALDLHDRISRAAIDRHDGWTVKDTGDGVMAVFATPDDAIAAAVDLQLGLQHADWTGEPLQVRSGLHRGPSRPAGADYHGATVNRCARIMGVAHGGQVLASRAVVEALEDPPGAVSLDTLGEHRLRDLERAVDLFQVSHPDLPTTFPPLRSLTTTPNNLPHVATPLIGREREVREIADLLDDHRLVTLTGAGGIGKTRLAVQLGAECLDTFPDGVWVVELASVTDPGSVVPAVSTALRVPDTPGRTPTDALLAHLEKRQLLLIVDNCEHLLGAVAALVDELLRNTTGLQVLTTSREPLNLPPERVLPVAPLPTGRESAGVRLFLERAAAVGADAGEGVDHDLVAQICHRLDGLPLAIELAASRARVLSLPELADRLDERFQLLTGGSRTALPRQRTLEATVAWSYDLLDADAQVMLQRLSVFAASFELTDAEQVCSAPPIDEVGVLDLVTELTERSLLTAEVAEASRYRMLDTIRAYARERLGETGDGEAEGLRDRHLAWTVAETTRAAGGLESPEQLVWLARVERRLDDHRAAMQWALDHDRLEQGARVASNLYRYWFLRGVREGREWLEPFAAQTDGLPDQVTARVLFTHGSLLQAMGEYAASLRSLRRSVDLYEGLDNPRGLAYALHYLMRSSWGIADRDEVRDLCERALHLFEDLGDPVGIGLSLLFVATDDYSQGRYEEGLEVMRRCEEVMRQIGAPHLVAHAPELTAWGLLATGDHSGAARRLAEAIELYDQVENGLCTAHCLETVSLLLAHHAPAAAATLLGAMEAIRDEIGVPVPPYENISVEPARRLISEALADEVIDQLSHRGRELSRGEALDRALREVQMLA